MEIFNNIKLNSVKLEDLEKKGWMNKYFLVLFTQIELERFFELEKNDNNLKLFDKQFSKLKNSIFKNISVEKECKDPSWILSTGTKNIDFLLDNDGLKSKEITLFYGISRSGKTQIAHQCICQVYLKFQKILPTKLALFIDSEKTFRPERIKQFAHGLNIPFSDVLKRIDVYSIQNLNEFKVLLNQIDINIQKNGIKFLIIDSLTKIFRYEMAKKERETSSIISEFSETLENLQMLAIKRNIPILVTSQVTAALNPSYFFEFIPILGKTLNIYIKQWILLGENEEELSIKENIGKRIAHLLNGNLKKELVVKFRITDNGIIDSF